jgi:hypothetical protein
MTVRDLLPGQCRDQRDWLDALALPPSDPQQGKQQQRGSDPDQAAHGEQAEGIGQSNANVRIRDKTTRNDEAFCCETF